MIERKCPGCGHIWDKDDIVGDDRYCQECIDQEITKMTNWLDNAPFLMGKLTEESRAIREKIISIILDTRNRPGGTE